MRLKEIVPPGAEMRLKNDIVGTLMDSDSGRGIIKVIWTEMRFYRRIGYQCQDQAQPLLVKLFSSYRALISFSEVTSPPTPTSQCHAFFSVNQSPPSPIIPPFCNRFTTAGPKILTTLRLCTHILVTYIWLGCIVYRTQCTLVVIAHAKRLVIQSVDRF